MPSVTYMNQSAPFWDFLASLEQQGSNHPLFSQHRNNENESGREGPESHQEPAFGPGGLGANFFSRWGMPHRGPPPRGPAGTPGHPYQYDFSADAEEQAHTEAKDKSKEKDNGKNDEETRGNNENGEGPSGYSGSDNEAHAEGRGRHGRRCGGPRRRGACGPGGWGGPWGRGGPHHAGHHYGDPHHGPGGHGRRGGWGRGGFFDAGFDPTALATQFWNQFVETDANATTKDNGDVVPDADVFDTESAYVVHISLPGAKKEDVGVNWNAEKSELSVAGVIYRPGDEEFLRTLAMDERKVGPFERKLRLGTRASPAHIDADGITAKLEDGILRVEVPKLDSGYVEIKKVDIE
ncbi:hypothetical protein ACEQ8H_007778 [Pleosporales sp. CAS-2024a]